MRRFKTSYLGQLVWVVVLALVLSSCNRDSSSDSAPAPGAPVGTLPGGQGVELSGTVGSYAYRAYVPSSYDGTVTHPLLVAMHGTGGSGSGSIGTWRALADSEGIIVLAPEYFDNDTYFTPAGEDAVFDMIAELDTAYEIDHRRRYLWGFSTGGSWSFVFGIVYANRFAASSVFAAGYTGDNLLIASMAARLIPYYLTHGLNDVVFPVANARDAEAALDMLGHDVLYEEHGGGHGFPGDAPAAAWAFMEEFSLAFDPVE